MIMKRLILLTACLFLAANTSAQWGKKIKGNGNVVTEDRKLGSYDEVNISGWFDVELVDGAEGTISLKGEENLLEYLKTEVKDGKLVVKPKSGYNLQSSWKSGGILVTIPVEDLRAISLSGSGDINGKKPLKSDYFEATMSGSGDINLDIESDELKVTLSGSGDIKLQGSAGNLEIRVSGSGDVNTYELEARNVNAVVSGSADLKVTAKESIKARVSGSGDIHYRGNPEKIDTKSSGSGDITKE